jgi:hypothetical protein
MPKPFYRGKRLIMRTKNRHWTAGEAVSRALQYFRLDYSIDKEAPHPINPLHRNVEYNSRYGIYFIKDMELDRIIINPKTEITDRIFSPRTAPPYMPLLNLIPFVNSIDYEEAVNCEF